MKIIVSTLRASDTSQAAALIGDLLSEIPKRNGNDVAQFSVSQAGNLMATLIEKEKLFGIAAIDAEREKFVGILTMYEGHSIHASGTFGMISEFYVGRGYRQHNIGRSLMDAAKRLAWQRSWNRLEVAAPTFPESQRASAFYEREGFSIGGGRKLKNVLKM